MLPSGGPRGTASTLEMCRFGIRISILKTILNEKIHHYYSRPSFNLSETDLQFFLGGGRFRSTLFREGLLKNSFNANLEVIGNLRWRYDGLELGRGGDQPRLLLDDLEMLHEEYIWDTEPPSKRPSGFGTEVEKCVSSLSKIAHADALWSGRE